MAMTAKQQTARWNAFVSWYRSNVSGDAKIPEELKKRYMANDGAWSVDRAMVWIRLHDPAYLKTKMATSRMEAMRQMYEKAYGFKIDWNKGKWKKYLEAFARAKPYINVNYRLNQIFVKRILPSKQFQQANPYFKQWLTRNKATYGSGSIIAALDAYHTYRDGLADEWAKYSTDPIPKSLLDEATKNGWERDSLAFRQALTSTKEWAKTASYEDRVRLFDTNWEAIFNRTDNIDESLREAFARDIDRVSFQEFFHAALKTSKVFKDAFPGYKKWEQAQHQAGAGMPGQVDIFDYFKRRADFENLWVRNFGDQVLPDSDFIDTAMDQNWDESLFLVKMRSLPAYTSTGIGKEKALAFDSYWHQLFGANAPIDEVIKSRFISSENEDPSVYWDDIKKTQIFKQQFQNWDVFQQGYGGTGQNIVDDPRAYKQYQKALRDAFEGIGMEMPLELERSLFSVGVNPDEANRRAELFRATKGAYQRQTGQTASIAEAMGASGGQMAGRMRDRLEKALARQKAFQESKPVSIHESETPGGLVTQNV